jgi:prolipoprotein diacylglyceryltransferase
MRIVIEFVKIDQVEFENGMLLNMGQLLSIPFLIVGLYFIGKTYF